MSSFVQAISHSSSSIEWLNSTRSARVMHVFESVCNLINPEGKVLSIVTPQIGNGPMNLVIPEIDFTKDMEAATSVNILDSVIAIGNTSISTEKSKPWQPIPDWPKLQKTPKLLRKYVVIIWKILSEEAPDESFALLSQNKFFKGNMQGNLQRSAKSIQHNISIALITNNMSRLAKESSFLAGLGNGLTPAGDDYIMGMMHALWALLPSEETKEICADIATQSARRTTPLSASWLFAAANGEAGEMWHELFEAIATNKEEAMIDSTQKILSTGHTSGADALGGFYSTILNLQL